MLKRLVYLVISGAVLSAVLVTQVSADTWVKDPMTKCAVWSGDDGSAREIISWSGACEDGKAIGRGSLVVNDKDGLAAVLEGEMQAGKVNGWGSIRFRNDETGEFDHYIGYFEDSKPKGDGIYDSSEGWRLEGYFDGAFDSGDGTLYLDENDGVIRGEFKNGDLVGKAFIYYETPEGEMYFGDMLDGARDGFGTLVHANDDAYVGEFEKGMASGTGYYEYSNGALVMGQYKNGSPNGAASVIDVNGDTYQGFFKDGEAHGMVLVTKADGSQSIETWVDGEKQE